jgi:glycosyltransferase involved in cell wall biosynthesis
MANLSASTPLPLISCVCVSKNRPDFLKKAISYFQNQTYPHKELIIVHEVDNETAKEADFHSDNITTIRTSPADNLTLGERRNLSVRASKGDYICVWDDDDWYHNKRLEIQMANLLKSMKPANILSRLILYDATYEQAYLSSERTWEGSLLCRTDLFSDNIKYTHVNSGEDNDLVVKLVKRDFVHSTYAPYLYTYIIHGNNTCDTDHFQQLFNAGHAFDSASSLLIKKIITGSYSHQQGSVKAEGLRFEVRR